MAFVLDASAALSWCFKNEVTIFTASLLIRAEAGEELLVPAHWPIEILSALLRGSRRGRIDRHGISGFIVRLSSLQIRVQESLGMKELSVLRTLCELHQLSAYDGTYLALAKRSNLPLATADGALVRACLAENVPVLT